MALHRRRAHRAQQRVLLVPASRHVDHTVEKHQQLRKLRIGHGPRALGDGTHPVHHRKHTGCRRGPLNTHAIKVLGLVRDTQRLSGLFEQRDGLIRAYEGPARAKNITGTHQRIRVQDGCSQTRSHADERSRDPAIVHKGHAASSRIRDVAGRGQPGPVDHAFRNLTTDLSRYQR